MKLSVLTDQISRDLDTACEQITSWGGRTVELRNVGEGPVGSNLAPGFLGDLCAALERWDVRVAAIAPQAFKLATSDASMRYHRRILLPASLHLAVMLKAQVVHVGAPLRPVGATGPCPDEALEILAEAAELAGNLGLILGLENAVGSWAGTGSEAAAIVKTIGHHAFQLTWDPAAGLLVGEAPFPAYQVVRSRLVSIRLRDVRLVGSSVQDVLPGDGQGMVSELLAALATDCFAGTVALDPHLTPRLEGSRASFESTVKLMMAAERAVRKMDDR